MAPRREEGKYLPHGLQLPLFALVGGLEVPHPLLQLLLLRLLLLTELPAPEAGLAVRGGQPQPQQLDTRLDGWGVGEGGREQLKEGEMRTSEGRYSSDKRLQLRVLVLLQSTY